MNDELVKQCRDCIDCLCDECKYEHLQKIGNFVPCMSALLGEVAYALEAADKRIAELSLDNKMLKNTIDADKGVMLDRKERR